MAQFARPDADTSAGNWTASSGSDLYAMLDESSASDSDYITVTDNFGSAEACTLSLSSVTDPADHTSTSVVVRAYTDSYSESVTLNVHLKDGSTSIKSENFTPSTSYSNHTMSLSTTQAASISSYANLTLILTATDGMGMGSETRISHAYFTCPDVSSGITVTPSAATADADGVNPTVSIGDPPVTASAITADADTSGPNVVVTSSGAETATFKILDANGKTYDEAGAETSSKNDGWIRYGSTTPNNIFSTSNDTRIGVILDWKTDFSTDPPSPYVGPTQETESWFRFTNVDLIKDTTIESAFLKLSVNTSNSQYWAGTNNPAIGFKVYGNDVDNATLEDSGNITNDVNGYRNKVLTTASTTYTYGSTALYNGDIVTIDVKDIVQEIVNRGGWSSGNALMILLRDNYPNNQFPTYQPYSGAPLSGLSGWYTYFSTYEHAYSQSSGIEPRLTVVYNNAVNVLTSPATAVASGANPTTEIQMTPVRAVVDTVVNGIGFSSFTITADANVAGPTVLISIPYSAAGPATANAASSVASLGLKIKISDVATSKADSNFGGLGLGGIKSTVAAETVVNALGFTPNPVTADADVVAPTVGTKESPADTKADTAGPTVVLGNLTVTPSPATAKANVDGPILSLTLAKASAKADVAGPTLSLSSLTVTPNPATAEADVSSSTDDLADIGLTVSDIATTDADVVAPTVVLGGYVITPSAATASTQSVTFSTLGLRGFAVSAETGVNTLSLTSGIGIGSITVTTTAATADASTTVADVETLLTPSSATAEVNVAGPTVSFSSVTITPSAASADASTSSSFTIAQPANTTATTDADVAGPTVVFSSDPVTPTAASLEGSTVVGQVILGGYALTPTASSSEAGITAPTTVLSSFSMTPTAATTDSDVSGPVIDIRTLITPAPATTDADVYNPQLTPAKITVAASTFFPRLLTTVSKIPEFATPSISNEDFTVARGVNDSFTDPSISSEYFE